MIVSKHTSLNIHACRFATYCSPNPCPNERQRAFLARAAGSFARAINETSKEFIARFMPAMGNRDDASLIELSAATRIFAALVFVRTWRQAALSGASIVLAKMGKIALAGIAGDRTVQRRLDRGLTGCKKPRIIPQGFTHVRLVCHRQSEYEVMGLMTVGISVSFVTGKPPNRACSKTRSSFSAR
jgi:hypothetical protein